jgi:hypothetical protein
MKKTFALILFSVLFLPVIGQVTDDVRLIDEFDPRQDCEMFEMRLDSLFAAASNDSPSIAYVVIRQGDNAFDNAIVDWKARQYRRIRNFAADRYSVVLTQGKGDIKVEHWIGKNGKAPPVISSNLNLVLPENQSRVLLPEDTIEMFRIDGRDRYSGDGNPSCLYAVTGLPFVWDILKANPGFDAELLIKTKSPKRYRHLVKILRREFLESGAPMERLKFVYGGGEKVIAVGDGKPASVVTSFVRNVRR